MNIADAARRAGRIVRTSELRRLGYSGREIASAAHQGTIRRIRIGWYCTPDTPEPAVDAVRFGGALTCVSAAHLLGLDAPHDDRLHVGLERNASRHRDPQVGTRLKSVAHAGVAVHWRTAVVATRGCASIVDLILDMTKCTTDEWVVACIDSALRQRRMSPSEMAELRELLPARRRYICDLTDTRSGSCIESIARVRLRRAGIVPELQAEIVPGRFVDMLVDGRLILEFDGREFHTGEERFESDRSRDAFFNALGRRVLRFSYRQVIHDWPTVESTVQLVRRQLARASAL